MALDGTVVDLAQQLWIYQGFLVAKSTAVVLPPQRSTPTRSPSMTVYCARSRTGGDCRSWTGCARQLSISHRRSTA
jgi:hypothetical protein